MTQSSPAALGPAFPEGPVLAQGHAPGKVILVGDHAVVHGSVGVAQAFDAVQVVAKIHRCAGALQLHTTAFGAHHFRGPRDLPDALKGLGASILAALDALHLPAECLAFTLDGTIPMAAGLGSSAASACALARALEKLAHHRFNEKQLLGIIEVAERHAHGKPSGLDAAAILAQGPVRFQLGQAQAIQAQPGPHWVVADSGLPRDTKVAIAQVAAHREQNQAQFQADLEHINAIAERLVGALARGEAKDLGTELDAAGSILAAWGVVAEGPSRLMHAMRDAGALGAKVTGAGCGGCVVAVAQNAAAASALREAALSAGARSAWFQATKVTQSHGP